MHPYLIGGVEVTVKLTAEVFEPKVKQISTIQWVQKFLLLAGNEKKLKTLDNLTATRLKKKSLRKHRNIRVNTNIPLSIAVM